MGYITSLIAALAGLIFIFIVGLYVGDMSGRARGKLECVAHITDIKDKAHDSAIKFKNTLNGLKTIVPRQ